MAQVGTDSATLYAISPEMLAYVIQEGEWGDLVEKNDWTNPRLDKIIREHGGAVFNTGADGLWDVSVHSDQWGDGVKEFGYTKPYGTDEFIKKLKEKVKKREKADKAEVGKAGKKAGLHRLAALADSNSGQLYVLSPEALLKLIENKVGPHPEWELAIRENWWPDHCRSLEEQKSHEAYVAGIIRELGGAVLYFGQDGRFEINAPDALREEGAYSSDITAHRTANRYLEAVKHPQITQGPFNLVYMQKYEELVDKLLKGLGRVEVLLRKAGIPLLPGSIDLVFKGKAGGSGRSSYDPRKRLLHITPNEKKDWVFVHEIGHFLHDTVVAGGFNNEAIKEKFLEVKNSFKKEKREKAKKAPPPWKLVQPGMEFEEEEGWENPFDHFTTRVRYTRRWRVLRKEKGKKVILELLNPSQWDQDVGRRYDTKSAEMVAWKIPELSDKLKDPRQEAREEEEVRYDTVLSGWVPTNYSMQNPVEFFAELLTAMVYKPGVLAPEVTTWIKNLLGSGSSSKTAKTFQIDRGDLVLYGKYKNKKGKVVGFGKDEKGQPTIEIEPIPKGRKQTKVLKLFKFRAVLKKASTVRDQIVDLYLAISRETGKSVIDAYRWKSIPQEVRVLKAIRQGLAGLHKYPLAWSLFQSKVNKIRLDEPRGTEEASWRAGGVLSLSIQPSDRTRYSALMWRWVVVHELGHALEDDAQIDYFTGIYGKPPYISAYAEIDASEDFAETFMALIERPRKLLKKAPAKYRDMRSRVAGKPAKETVMKIVQRVAARYIQASPYGYYNVTLIKGYWRGIGPEWDLVDNAQLWAFKAKTVADLLANPKVKELIRATRTFDWEWLADDYIETTDYREHLEPEPRKPSFRPMHPGEEEEVGVNYSLHVERSGLAVDWTEDPVTSVPLLKAFGVKQRV